MHQRADHAESGRTVADRAVNLLALVEMGEEIVAVAFQVVADEVGVIAVGDEADALAEKRVLGLDLFQADRACLARNIGNAGNLIDQVALRDPAQREDKLHPHRDAVKHRAQGKADQGRGKRAPENDNEGMGVHEHTQITAHQDQAG